MTGGCCHRRWVDARDKAEGRDRRAYIKKCRDKGWFQLRWIIFL